MGRIYLRFIPITREKFEMSVIKSARGINRNDARQYVKNISYDWQQDDSLLMINRYFYIKGKKKIRYQKVSVDIKFL